MPDSGATASTTTTGTLPRSIFNCSKLLSIRFSIIFSIAQNYIGDKVRLAEKLRERSKYLMTSAKVILESLLIKKITEEDLFPFCNSQNREYENQETKIIDQLTQDLDNYDHNSKKDNHSIVSKWTRSRNVER